MKLTRLIGIGVAVLAAALIYAPIARAATTFTVTARGDEGDANTADNLCASSLGQCTLRAAIQQANATSGADTIYFNIIGLGPHPIRPATPLPAIYEQVTIDGTTQPGYFGTPAIELDGSLITAPGDNYGLRLIADGNIIRGLAINRFQFGIDIRSDRNVIEGNFVGTDPAGTTARPNTSSGISVGGSHNIIGGPSGIMSGESCVLPCNLISGNGRIGIGLGATGNRVQGNLIGTDLTGNAALGNGAGGNPDAGVVIGRGSSNNVVGGVGLSAAPTGNVISGNNGNGILIDGWPEGSDDHFVDSNFIGLNAAGTAAVPNTLDGINIQSGSNNVIGYTTFAGRQQFMNVISGNGGYGIHISGDGAVGNRLMGNRIGTDRNGIGTTTVALPNLKGGIDISSAVDTRIGGPRNFPTNEIYGHSGSGLATGIFVGGGHGTIIANNVIANNGWGIWLMNGHDNVIGGTAVHTRNYIQSNTIGGVYIDGPDTHHNSVLGNTIGLGMDGMTPAGNGRWGVYLSTQAHHNTIGGATPEARNVISGHTEAGIVIDTAGGTGANRVLGNYIGTDAIGMSAVGNGTGVRVSNPGNAIGGAAPGEGNLISGNTFYGLYILGVAGLGTTVEGNRIGVDASGAGPLPNNGFGIFIQNSSNTRVGGTTGVTPGGACSGACNLIAYNNDSGISISANAGIARGNVIQGNAIFGNSGLAIDLGIDRVTPNDSGDGDGGANLSQNFPALTSATTNGTNTTAAGALNSSSGTRYRVELFANTTCDASGYGEGERYLGFVEVTTNGSGNVSFSVPSLPALPAGQFITATATNIGSGDTSEFSACAEVMMTTIAPVVAAMESLRNDVSKLVLADGLTRPQGKALDQLLHSAIKQMEKGNTKAAEGKLNAFINKLNGWMKAGKVDPKVGQPLVGSANAIIQMINNPQPTPGDPVEPPGN